MKNRKNKMNLMYALIPKEYIKICYQREIIVLLIPLKLLKTNHVLNSKHNLSLSASLHNHYRREL